MSADRFDAVVGEGRGSVDNARAAELTADLETLYRHHCRGAAQLARSLASWAGVDLPDSQPPETFGLDRRYLARCVYDKLGRFPRANSSLCASCAFEAAHAAAGAWLCAHPAAGPALARAVDLRPGAEHEYINIVNWSRYLAEARIEGDDALGRLREGIAARR